jgi:hypothetical protein
MQLSEDLLSRESHATVGLRSMNNASRAGFFGPSGGGDYWPKFLMHLASVAGCWASLPFSVWAVFGPISHLKMTARFTQRPG